MQEALLAWGSLVAASGFPLIHKGNRDELQRAHTLRHVYLANTAITPKNPWELGAQRQNPIDWEYGIKGGRQPRQQSFGNIAMKSGEI